MRKVSVQLIGSRLFIKLISIAIVALSLASASPARAQDAEKARELFQQGSKYYDLGQFDKAIEAWQQGYDQKPDPGFLYNIAQAYRQKQDAAKAIFFYKGYLRNSPKAKNRSEVDQKIAALQKQLDAGAPGTTTPPPGNGTTTPTTNPTTTTVAPPPGTSTMIAAPPTEPPPAYGTPPPAGFGDAPPMVAVEPAPTSVVSAGHLELNAGLGPAFWQTGVDGSAKPSFVFNLGAGWLFGNPTSRFRFRLGAMFGYTFLAANEDKSNVGFVSLLADPGLEIRLNQTGRLYLDFDLALGLQWATNVQLRSKLLDPMVPIMSVDGPQGMAQVRAGAALGYRFTPQLAAFSSLSQSSSPKKQFFYSDIKRVEWLFGLAYRF